MVRVLEVRPEAGVEEFWREFGEWRKGPPAVEFVGGLWRFVEEVGGLWRKMENFGERSRNVGSRGDLLLLGRRYIRHSPMFYRSIMTKDILEEFRRGTPE
jgi:hypothetical protein